MRKDDSSTERKLNDRKRKQMFYYNKASKSLKPLKPLKEGDTVFVRPARRSKEWKRATVKKAVGIRSYGVTTEQGNKIRRNRRHLRLARNEQSPSNTVSAKDIGVYVDPPGPLITDSNQIDQPKVGETRTTMVYVDPPRPLITDSNQMDQPDVGETRTTMDNSRPLTTDSNQIYQAPDVGKTRTESDDSNDNTRVFQSRNMHYPIRYSSRGRVLRKPVYLKNYDY